MKFCSAIAVIAALVGGCASDVPSDIVQRAVYDDQTHQREKACEGLHGDREAECLYEARKPYEKRNDPPPGGK